MNQGKTIDVATTRFGDIKVKADTVLTFPHGLVGLEQLQHFVLIDGSGPFQWMQSMEDPDITFVVVDSDLVISEYQITPSEDDVRVVMAEAEPAPLVAMLIVTVPRDPDAALTANLMAPLLINTDVRIGVQSVLPERYPVNHPILERHASVKVALAG